MILISFFNKQEEVAINCPSCLSDSIKKNGHIYNGKQNYRCKVCGRQFVEDRELPEIDERTKEIVVNLLLERLSLRGICRTLGVSLTWLLWFFKKIASEIPEDMAVVKKQKSRITIEIDEMWSFVGKKQNKVWVWLAIDLETRQIVGFHVGNRSKQDARQLWKSLPGVYRQCAVCYTDFWEAYSKAIPNCRHRAVGKESGKTNHIERFNCTIRQRVSRMVRKTLSFSKILENHILALKYFIWNYNLAKTSY
jgi:IS1 family transposase/DNA-directed RNA polymerase subunit RPC12/RpoP